MAKDNERISATYLVETPMDPEKAAQILAGEQSSGTFVDVPGETEELKLAYAPGPVSVHSSKLQIFLI